MLAVPMLLNQILSVAQSGNITLSAKDLMAEQSNEGVVKLQLFSDKSRVFVPYTSKQDDMGPFGAKPELRSKLQVALIIRKLVEDCACTDLNLSTAPIRLSEYQSFIGAYTIDELADVKNQIAKQIMDPTITQTHRQAELRCVLALVYLQQDRADKAMGQFKQAEKTAGFVLPGEFADLYQALKHPERAHNKPKM